MNVVFLSPHFPPHWYRFVAALREAGATTLGITDRHWDELRPELRDSLTDHYRVDDLGNYDQLVRAVGWFIHRHGRIDRVDSLLEHWLETEAALRTDFNIPGIDRRGIVAIKRKSLMKKRFEAAGVPVARGRVCRTARALKRFVEKVGYPVVAKPDVGVGAAGTYKLSNDADLDRFLADKPDIDYFVEEFVEGDLLTYDGLADRDGNIVFDSTFTYSTGVMESVNEQRDLYYLISRQVPADIREVGSKMAAAFDLRERPFHFEMFRTREGRLVALEVNMRPPGGFTVDMFNFANDFDFYRAWANMVVHGRFDATITRPYACMYVCRRDGRHYAMTHEDVLREFAPLIVFESRMEPVFAGAMGDQAFILRAPSEKPLRDAAQQIQARA
jgi:hypothetical protein